MSINRVWEVGNLTHDPELRSTPSGSSVLEFSLAVNDRILNKQTEAWEDRPNFFDVAVFGRRGEALAGILTKGMKVAVEGRLRWSSWETQDGQKRSKVSIVATDVELMSRSGTAPAAAVAAPPAAESSANSDGTFAKAGEFMRGGSVSDDDDIPF